MSNAAFWGMAGASVLHALEEYVYPGGFLRWLRIWFPRSAPGVRGAILINGAFFAFVLSPLVFDPRETPVFSVSIAGLLLANGALHVVGTFLTGQYSPGAVTSVVCYFPASLYTLGTMPSRWHMSAAEIVGALILGVIWQLIPLLSMAARR